MVPGIFPRLFYLYQRKNNNNNDTKCKEKRRLGENSESQMEFEPMTLRDLVGSFNHWAAAGEDYS